MSGARGNVGSGKKWCHSLFLLSLFFFLKKKKKKKKIQFFFFTCVAMRIIFLAALFASIALGRVRYDGGALNELMNRMGQSERYTTLSAVFL